MQLSYSKVCLLPTFHETRRVFDVAIIQTFFSLHETVAKKQKRQCRIWIQTDAHIIIIGDRSRLDIDDLLSYMYI